MKDLVEDLQKLLNEFYSLGEQLAPIFLFYLNDIGARYVDTWFRMKYWQRYAEDYIKYSIGDYSHLLRGLKTVREDWTTVDIFLVAAFNNGFYHSDQWYLEEKLYKLIRRFEVLIERFEKGLQATAKL